MQTNRIEVGGSEGGELLPWLHYSSDEMDARPGCVCSGAFSLVYGPSGSAGGFHEFYMEMKAQIVDENWSFYKILCFLDKGEGEKEEEVEEEEVEEEEKKNEKERRMYQKYPNNRMSRNV